METIDQIKKDLKAAKSFKRTYEDAWLESYRQYLSSSEPKYFPDGRTKRSSVFVPYAFSNVEGVVARVSDIIVPNDDWFDVTGAEMKDKIDAEKMAKLLKYGFQKAYVIDKLHDFLKLWAVFGFAVAKVYWSRNKKRSILFNPVTEQGVETGVIVPEAVSVEDNYPGFDVISPFNLHVDPAATNLCNARYIIHEDDITVQELIDGAEDGIYDSEKVAQILSELGSDYRKSDLIRILEYWTDDKLCVMTLPGGEDDSTANIDEIHSYRGTNQSAYKDAKKVGEYLLREEENPFLHGVKPFVGDSYTRLPNQVYGVGIVEPNQRLQETLNTMVNMIIDNWNQGINRRYVYSKDADIDLNDLTQFNVPGGLVGVNGGDASKAVFPLPSFVPSPGDYGILDLIKSMIALSSGMDDFYSRGQGSARSNRTASGIQQVMEQMGFRFKDLIKNLEQRVLKPMLDMNVSLWQQFIADNQPLEVRITGEAPMVRVTPIEIYKQFDFVPTAATNLMNKSVKLSNIAQFTQMFGQSPFVDQYELISSYAELVDLPPGVVYPKPPKTVTQDEENLVLLSGQPVPVNLWDNHQQHLQDLQKAQQSPIFGFLPPEVKQAAFMATQQHGQAHMMAMQQLQQGMIQQHQAPPSRNIEQEVEAESQAFSDATAGYSPGESQPAMEAGGGY